MNKDNRYFWGTKRFKPFFSAFVIFSLLISGNPLSFSFNSVAERADQQPIVIASASSAKHKKDDSDLVPLPEKGNISSNKKTTNKTMPQKKETFVFEGEIDGEGTFVFQENRVFYKHSQYDYPKDVKINGQTWSDLNEPFELGYYPDLSSALVMEKTGRDTIRGTSFSDKFELYFYDSSISSAIYRVSIQFNILKPAAQTMGASPTTKSNDSSVIPQKKKNGEPPVKDQVTTGGDKPQSKTIRDEDRLPGVFYNLCYTAKGEKSNFATVQNTSLQYAIPDPKLIQFLKRFVLGTWFHASDEKSLPVYTDLNQYYRSPIPIYKSFFYLEKVQSSSFVSSMKDKKINTSGWIGIHSGYVVAPFSGIFRFVGSADDALLVRFNQQIVLDYGYYSLSQGKTISSQSSAHPENTSKDKMSIFRKNEGSDVSKNDRVELYHYKNIDLAKGQPIRVIKGKVYPIEVLYSDLAGGMFSLALFVERLDSDAKPSNEKLEKRLLLFRTTQELPAQARSFPDFPRFNPDSPIWRVVDGQGRPIQKSNTETTE